MIEQPIDYKCSKCNARDCKLWREYQTFLEGQCLYCLDCAAKNQKRDVSNIDEQGKIPIEGITGLRSDSIGWLVPAVPTEEMDTFWGYSSVPQHLVEWWHNLPNRTPSKEIK